MKGLGNDDRLAARYFSFVEEGAALFEEKEYAPALNCFWKAFRLRPSAPVVLFDIGRTMEMLEDPRAEHFYAAAATQGNIDALYQLATFCLHHGRSDEGIEHLKAFLKGSKGAKDKFTEWAQNMLQQLRPRPVLVRNKE